MWVLYGQKWAHWVLWVLYGQEWAQYWPEKVLSKSGLNRGRNGRTSPMWVLCGQKWAHWVLWVLSGQKWAHWALYGQKWAQYWLLVHLESIWTEMGALSLCGCSMGRNGRSISCWYIWNQFGQKWAQWVYVGALWAEMGTVLVAGTFWINLGTNGWLSLCGYSMGRNGRSIDLSQSGTKL